MTIALDLRNIARALGGEVNPKGFVLAPGPGHSARDRSLSIRLDAKAPDGILVNSFAGDDPLDCKDYIRGKLGLPEWKPGNGASAGDILAGIGAKAARAKQNGAAHAASRVVAEYVYRQKDGTPYLKVLRTEPKGFKQQHWTGSAWEWGKPAGEPIPYRLPEMLAAVRDTVLVCEGEKDAERLAALGFIATTAPEGAGKWTAALNHWFEWKSVYVLADNDKPGRDHAHDVARNLHGVASDVRVVNLPGVPEKGDVSDWLDAGGDPDGLIDLCKSLPEWEPPAEDAKSEDAAAPEGDTFDGPEIFSAATLRTKTFPPIAYVVPGYIVEGCTILAGRPKLGKSWLMLDIGLAVARGGFTLGSVRCPEGDVLYLALEDNQRRMQSRMTKILGAFQEWPARFLFATEWPRADQGGLEHIRRWIASAEKPRLVVVDVLAAFRSPRGRDATLYESDYAAVKALQQIASDTGVAIVIVHHLRKSGTESDPFEKVSGTLGLSGGADTTLVLDRDGNGATLYGRGRDIEEIETAVEFDRQTCRWRILGEAAEVRRTDERSTILAALHEAEEPMSPADIADAIRMPRNNAKQLLFKMAKDGEVRKLRGGRGRYIHPDRTDLDNHTPSDNHDNHDNHEEKRATKAMHQTASAPSNGYRHPYNDNQEEREGGWRG